MQIDKLEILRVASKDLTNISYSNLLRLINDLGLTNIVSFYVAEGEFIYRLRPSEDKPFTKQSEISFNPDPKQYGRANKPNQAMFYGSLNALSVQNPILTNTAEIIHVLANGSHNIIGDSIELTFGKWRVEKPFPVIPMIFDERHLLKNKIFKPLYDKYMNANINNEKNRRIIKFIANEFSKVNISNHLDYKITAAFTEFLFKNYENKIEAIIYPSVRTEGDGLNIALTPNFVNKYLKIHSVCTMRLYYKHGIGALDYETIAEQINEDGTFELKKITEHGITKGRDWCMKENERRFNENK